MKTSGYKPPSRIYVDVTNACPLRCLHCCSCSGDACDHELTGAEIKDIIDQVREMSTRNLVLSGGEPMLRPDLFDLLEHACARGLGVTLLTSGILMERSAARALADLDIRVKISLDGVRKETHDFLRGRGSFEKALQALILLKEEGVKERSIHFTTHTKNIDELPALADFLPAAGIHNLVVGTIKPSGRAKENQSLLIPPALYPYFKQRVSELSKRGTIFIQSFADRDWEGFGCPATCNKFGLTASGSATTCVFFGTELQGGSIRDRSLRELWEQYRAGTALFTANSSCRECPVLPVMGGGCRARAMYYSGDRNGRDPYCCALYEKKLFLDSYGHLCENALQGLERAFR